MSDEVKHLFEGLARQVRGTYRSAQDQARRPDPDPQRAGHMGEATWSALFEEWLPQWPVVTRKYLVGQHGSTNEIDVILLKPGYPKRLRNDAHILMSGVAAAFSSRLSYKKSHVKDALDEKQNILSAAYGGETPGSAEEVLRGPFPYGLLCHGPVSAPSTIDPADHLREHYDACVGEPGPGAAVQNPRDELDLICVAESVLAWTDHVTVTLHPNGEHGPQSALMMPPSPVLPGAPLAHLVAWLSIRLAGEQHQTAALGDLLRVFGGDTSSGFQRNWSMSVYPDHIRRQQQHLLNPYGYGRIV